MGSGRPKCSAGWTRRIRSETYPQIARRAQAEGAKIHWGDDTGLRSDDVRGRAYAPKEKTLVVR